MVTQNTTLRLYKIPKESQLLIRLGGAWHSLTPIDLPLPTPNKGGAITTLRALAARIPADGPHINTFPEVPLGSPSWNGRAMLIPKHAEWDYDLIANALTEACLGGRTVNVYCDAVVSNRNRDDEKLYRG
jgi:hypothetical protein